MKMTPSSQSSGELAALHRLSSYPILLVILLCAFTLALPGPHLQAADSPAYRWENFAGQPGVPGFADDAGIAARFNNPRGAALNWDGSLLVADTTNQVIRRVTREGVVSTVAGVPGQSGGVGILPVKFRNPAAVIPNGANGYIVADSLNYSMRWILSPNVETHEALYTAKLEALAMDSANIIYVADSGGSVIWRMGPLPTWSPNSLAGALGQEGSSDGPGSTARFNEPAGVAADGAGNVYVADSSNHTIRRVKSDRTVATFAGLAGQAGFVDGFQFARFNSPRGLAVDSVGNVYVADSGNRAVRRITPDGVVTTIGAGNFNGPLPVKPWGVAVDHRGIVYVTDAEGHRILKGTPLPPMTMGGLKAEYFQDIPEWTLVDLFQSTKVKNDDPDIVELTPQFESRRDFSDNYGARLSGWLIPPTTGNYKFYLTSDDQGALFLGTNVASAALVQIALEPAWNGYRQFITGDNQTSRGTPPKNISTDQWLEAGRPYYIEAWFKEGVGGDHLSVAWLPPDGATVTNGSAPIGGRYLASGGAYSGTFAPIAPAFSLTNSGQVCVNFGRLLNRAAALNPANYRVNGSQPTGVVLAPDQQGVLLNVPGLAGATFSVEVSGILDAFDNPMSGPTTLSGQVLPQSRADVGSPAAPGIAFAASTSLHGMDFDVLAGGSDIWNTSDQFHFIHEERTGDFDVQVRVESLEAVNRWSKAGLMVRESLAAGSRHITVDVFPAGTTRDGSYGGSGQNEYELMMRAVSNGATVSWAQAGASVAEPAYPNAWMRLKRQGNTFTAYRSSNSYDWTLIGQTNQDYPATVFVGLATLAHNDSPDFSALARYRSYESLPPPVILEQPRSVVTAVGAATSFRVTATDVPHLRYLWRKYGQPVSGADSPTLTLSPVQATDAGTYDVQVINANGTAVSIPVTLKLASMPPGGLKAEYFLDQTGAKLSDLTGSTKFLMNQPDIVEVTRDFESRRDFADNYGARFSGWLIPPITGDYQFYLASDNQGALFLSSDANPANKVQIAFEPNWASWRNFAGEAEGGGRLPDFNSWPTHVSEFIFLPAGQPYYVEALLKEGEGGDHLSVAWQPPGGSPVFDGTEPIPGQYLVSDPPYVGTFAPVSATSLTNSGQIGVYFNRLLESASACRIETYQVNVNGSWKEVTGAMLSPDRRGVLLNADGISGATFSLQVGKVNDVYGNPSTETVLNGVVLPQSRQDIETTHGPTAPGVTFSSRSGDFDVVAGGSDIWGTADEFHFVYEVVSGDFDVQVRVESLEPENRWSKAGLMVRETLAPDSRHLMLNVDPIGATRDGLDGGIGQNIYEVVMRASTGGATVSWAQPGAVLSDPRYQNAWLRLRRQGNTFTAFRSADGMVWTQLGQASQSYSGSVHVGLATTAHNNSPGFQTAARYRSYKRVIALPSIIRPPQDVVAAGGAPATFSVTAAGTPPLTYQWRRNGVPLPGANAATYVIPAVQVSDYGFYDVEISDAIGSVISAPAKLMGAPLAIIVQAQSVVPRLGSAASFSITATGSPPLRYQWQKNYQDIPGATAATYTILSVRETDLGSYRMVVTDFSGSVVSSPATLTPFFMSLGGLQAEYFLNLPGSTLSDLTNSTSFQQNRPDIVEVTPYFESRRDFANNYGARLSGWLIPTSTGQYTFYIASDDQGVLFLSTDEKPENKVRIAIEPQWNGYRQYVGDAPGEVLNPGTRGQPPTNRSPAIKLVEGKAYYVEALLKEAGGGDNLSVTWGPTGEAEPVYGAYPIGGQFLAHGIALDDSMRMLTATKTDDMVSVTWTGPGILQSAATVTGPYTDVAGSTSPYEFAPSTPQRFFRLHLPVGDVYSLNAVGYVRMLFHPGFSLIANPLNTDGNQLSDVLPVLPGGSQLYKWSKGYTTNTYDSAAAAWTPDAIGALAPGQGGVLRLPSEVSVTYVGQVPQGALSVPLNEGLSLVSSRVPQAGKLVTDLKFPIGNGDVIYTHANPGGHSIYHYSDLFGWVPEEPVMFVGQAFWVKRVAAGSWDRNFSVNQ